MDLNLNEDNIYISRIYKGLSADVIGLKPNDRVTGVNDFHVDHSNLCDSFFKLREETDRSENVSIKVLRDDEEIVFKLQKEEIK